eukprot:6201176-Pleurochrysis_carterae.AAC.2
MSTQSVGCSKHVLARQQQIDKESLQFVCLESSLLRFASAHRAGLGVQMRTRSSVWATRGMHT